MIIENSETGENPVGVIGMTVTGLAWAGVLAGAGVSVMATDMDEETVNACLEENELPGEEPGLEKLIREGEVSKKLTFCPTPRRMIRGCPVIFVTCMTPPDDDGRPGLRMAEAIVRMIAQQAPEDRIVALKICAGIGSAAALSEIAEEVRQSRIEEEGKAPEIRIVSTPELYDEGRMISAMKNESALLCGVEEPGEGAPDALLEILCALNRGDRRIVICTREEAEAAALIESARIAAEQSLLSEAERALAPSGIRFDSILNALDKQARTHNRVVEQRRLLPGIGGRILPKEVREWQAETSDRKRESQTIDAVLAADAKQAEAVEAYLSQQISEFDNPVIAVIGLSASPGTDDLRETPAVEILKHLADPFAETPADAPKPFRLYIPAGMSQAKWRLFLQRDAFAFCDSPLDAMKGADLVICLGRIPNPNRILTPSAKKRMRGSRIVDATGALDREKAAASGFDYRLIFEEPES